MWLIKSLTRHYKKNLLLILTVFVISILFFVSTAIRENSSSQIEDFLSTYKVTAYYMKRESFYSNRPGGAWLPPDTAAIPLKYEEYLSSYSLTRNLPLTVTNASGENMAYASVLALTDLTMVNRPEIEEAELVGYTNEDFNFTAKTQIALISTALSDILNATVGDDIVFYDDLWQSNYFTVCGVFKSENVEAVIPVSKTRNIYVVNPNITSDTGPRLLNFYDTNLFVLKDMNEARDFKLAMSQEHDFRAVKFVVDDGELSETISPLETTINYMDSALIILLVISILIAFTISFILLKSRNVEIAIMYCIGLSKIKIFLSLFVELALTTLFAIFVGALVGLAISLNYIGDINILDTIDRLALLLAALSLGAAASIISSIAIKPMDILTKKE